MNTKPILNQTSVPTGGWQPIVSIDRDQWLVAEPATDGSLQKLVEAGVVVYLPHLPFTLHQNEQVYLDPAYTDEKRKSIYIRSGREGVLGTNANEQDRMALWNMLKRYESASMGLLGQLFPAYVGKMKAAGTSFRPRAIGSGAAALSWRKDDTRLHVDAFPSNPTNGMRILRVFSNIGTAARVWRVGEPFEKMARHFLPTIRAPFPGSSQLLYKLGITKRLRSGYDHYMLKLHDAAKADLGYQEKCQQVTAGFPPGSSWICYSDQVMHAAMSGQHMMEQTIHVPMSGLSFPEDSPLRVLERLTGKALLN